MRIIIQFQSVLEILFVSYVINKYITIKHNVTVSICMYIETNFKIKQKYTLLLYLIHRKSRKIKLTFNHIHNLKGCSKYSLIILLFHIIVFCTIFHRIYQMCSCILLLTILHIIVKTKRNEIKNNKMLCTIASMF